MSPTSKDSLSAWLKYLGGIHVSAIDMGLERVLPVFYKLAIQKDALVFTVAGTNGKGSTTAMIAEICRQAGYKTALYQSPHLVSFNERVRINGIPIDDKTLINAFNTVEQARIACGASLSFFEMTTLAAFCIFATSDCDVWVLEIGLGGRLDVVNIIDPDVCVITNIAIDHTDWLGDTQEQIGYEKAGILRQGVPCVYGEMSMPASVKQIMASLDSLCYRYGVDYDFNDDFTVDDGHWVYSAKACTLVLPYPAIALINACHAITAVLASPLTIYQSAITKAMQSLTLAGRFDGRWVQGRYWLFDVAHNEAGVAFLLTQLLPRWHTHQANYPKTGLQMVFSMLADKDTPRVLALIAKAKLRITAWHIAPLDSPRTMTVEQLAYHIKQSQLEQSQPLPTIYRYAQMGDAAQGVMTTSSDKDFIVCFGSFHTIGESMVALGLIASSSE